MEWLKPADAASEIATSPDRILDLIHSGQLIAVNIAQNATGKPRWRIRRKDFEDFLARRSTRPAATAPKRRQRDAGVIEFFK